MSFASLVAKVDRSALALLGGVPVVYHPKVGSPVTVTGIFDALYVLAKGDALAGAETLGPAVFLLLVDLPIHPELDEPTLTIGAVDYRVTERKPDDMGGILLALRKAT